MQAALALGVLAVVAASLPNSAGRTLTYEVASSAAPSGQSGEWKTVRYRGAAIDVPASWPVYDLSVDTSRCVRWDEHAVYVGDEGDTPRDCPAHLVGKTEAVQLAPVGREMNGPAEPVTVNGNRGRRSVLAAGSNETLIDFDGLKVRVLATYMQDKALSDAIVNSIRGAR